jgi:hypothetical protein
VGPAPATPSPRSRRPLPGRAPGRRVGPALVALVLAALLGLVGVGTAQLATTAAASTAGASAVSLVDDDGGAALFSSAGLSPGVVQAACVGLTARGSVDPSTEVSLTADVQPGGLSPYLQVWVEQGAVPAGASCGAFSGSVVWSGTLDRFPATGTAGIATGWHPAVTPRSVYRVTVTVLDDPRAQGLRTSASFRWAFSEAAPPPRPATPATVAAPTTDDVPTPAAPQTTDTPSATPTTTAEQPVPAPPTTPPSTPPPTPPSAPPPASGHPRAVVEAEPIASGPVAAVQAALAAAGQAVQQVGRTAVAVAHNGQFPVALVGVVAAFLFLQGRLDRRDPKLALARVREELSEFREFPEPPPTETT